MGERKPRFWDWVEFWALLTMVGAILLTMAWALAK